MSLAAIDLGSTSSRLLVERAALVERSAVFTNMGAGLSASGSISSDGLARVEDALERFRTSMGEVDHLMVVATAAARSARNCDALAEIVGRVLGAELQVLSGHDEAGLSYRGAVSGLAGLAEPLVIDVGGRSTEFVLAGGEAISLEMGAAAISEEFLLEDPPGAAELSAALSVIAIHLDDVVRELPAAVSTMESGQVIGVGGTITTAVAVELGMVDYDRAQIEGFVLSKPAAEDVFRTLATEGLADRIHNPGLDPERAGIIVGGLCILVALMRRFSLDSIIVSDHGLLEGLLAQMHEQEL